MQFTDALKLLLANTVQDHYAEYSVVLVQGSHPIVVYGASDIQEDAEQQVALQKEQALQYESPPPPKDQMKDVSELVQNHIALSSTSTSNMAPDMTLNSDEIKFKHLEMHDRLQPTTRVHEESVVTAAPGGAIDAYDTIG